MIPHGDFIDARAPEKGWVPLEPLPRYLSNYVGLRNRLSGINEQYPYVDFETRVKGCYALLRAFVDFAHANAESMSALVRDADRRAIARRTLADALRVFGVEWTPQALERRFTIQGYEMEVTETPTGRPRVHPTERKKTLRERAVSRTLRRVPFRHAAARLPHREPRAVARRETAAARDRRRRPGGTRLTWR